MIEVRNLTKRYGTHLAVDHISFDAQPGEILGLLGPNGAGKTTTMRVLTGYMPPTEGHAKVAGYDVMTHSLEVRQRVGYLPERVPIYPDMTVREFVQFWANLRGVKKPNTQTDAMLERFHLTDRKNMLVRSLSKGLRQRLGLAQALVHNPEVVILDEPTIGIDPQQVIEVRNNVRQLAREHTVLFSTHILSEAEQVCDRVLIINKGHIVAAGKPDELRQQLQPGESLYVVASGGSPPALQHLLMSVNGVRAVEAQAEGFIVRGTAGADIRAALSGQITQAGYTLLELRPVAMTLEDIFLDIVGRS
jgi:ABC-2 type transport system ATP-binding protein